MATDRTLAIVDNGAYTIKAGIIGQEDEAPLIIPNCMSKLKGGRSWLIADELERAHNYAGLYYRLPFEKGILVDWDVERMVWERLFSDNLLKCEPSNTWLWLTEPCLNLPNVQAAYDQVIFEEFEFDGCSRKTAPEWCIRNDLQLLFNESDTSLPVKNGDYDRDCVLVVDIGYSSTQAIPFLHGQMIHSAIRRLNVGGKFLTNHLKEMISFRQWNMMDETYLVNQIKETCCFVSSDLHKDLRICHENPRANSIVQAYVLPDFVNTHQGYVKPRDEHAMLSDDEQVLWMNNERFTVPEVLFHPSDIGMPQAGLAELIQQVVQATPGALHALLYANIVVVGGSAQYPGLYDRLSSELRQLVPSEYTIRIALPDQPITYAWRGARRYVKQCSISQLKEDIVTRATYQEEGTSVHYRR